MDMFSDMLKNKSACISICAPCLTCLTYLLFYGISYNFTYFERFKANLRIFSCFNNVFKLDFAQNIRCHSELKTLLIRCGVKFTLHDAKTVSNRAR